MPLDTGLGEFQTMRSIAKIRERVAGKEQLIGPFVEQRAKYGEQLIFLMKAVEERIHAQHREVERQKAEMVNLNEENERLCDIIATILQPNIVDSPGLEDEILRELARARNFGFHRMPKRSRPILGSTTLSLQQA